jgi:hypothetical protein
MAQKCRAITSKGKPCLAFARRDDPEQLCIYHSRLGASGSQREHQPVTKGELTRLIEKTIRQVRRSKCNPLERSRELRALILELDKLKTPEMPAPRRTGCNVYQ